MRRRRIVHAAGDGSGREVMRALIASVRGTPSITVIEGVEARRLMVEDNAITLEIGCVAGVVEDLQRVVEGFPLRMVLGVLLHALQRQEHP